MNGGAECPRLSEIEACNSQACPIDCVVGDWSEWSACSNPCNTGPARVDECSKFKSDQTVRKISIFVLVFLVWKSNPYFFSPVSSLRVQ